MLPDLVEAAKRAGSGVQWWAPPDLADAQAEIVAGALRNGRCSRHAVLIGDLAAMTIRAEALARALPVIPPPPRRGG